MVANPANTNALILKENAPSIPDENITCLTRLDHNRALGQIAEKANVAVTDVKNVIIWGNHSSSQYPDVNHGTVKGKPIREVIGDDEYLNNEFIQTVQQRGAAIIKVSTSYCIEIISLILCVYDIMTQHMAGSFKTQHHNCMHD